MLTYYYTTDYSVDVQEKEFTRVSEHFGFFRHPGARRETREGLNTEYRRYFPTREGAITYRRGQLRTRVRQLKSSLERAENDLKQFEEKYPENA